MSAGTWSAWAVYADLSIFLICYALYWYVSGWRAAVALILPPPPKPPRPSLIKRLGAALAPVLRAVAATLFAGPLRDGGASPAPAMAEVCVEAPLPAAEVIIDHCGMEPSSGDHQLAAPVTPWWARGSSVETSP